MGRHSRTCRVAPALRSPLRHKVHRDSACRDRSPCANHPRKRCPLHMGRARDHQRPYVSSAWSRGMDRKHLAGTARPRCYECRQRPAAERASGDTPYCPTRFRAHTHYSPLSTGFTVVPVSGYPFRPDQLAAALASSEPFTIFPVMYNSPPRLYQVSLLSSMLSSTYGFAPCNGLLSTRSIT